ADMTDILITPLVVPASADAPDAGEFRAMVDLGNRAAELDAGISDLSDTAEQLLPSWLDESDHLHRGFIARRGGVIVGAASVTTATEQGATSAEFDLMLLPPHAEDGVGAALLQRVEEESRALGRSTLQSWTLHPASEGERMLTPGTGWGRVATT